MDDATKEAIRVHTEACMKEQQAALLQTASKNALSIIDTKVTETQVELRDAIDNEVAGFSKDYHFTNIITATTMSSVNKSMIFGNGPVAPSKRATRRRRTN